MKEKKNIKDEYISRIMTQLAKETGHLSASHSIKRNPLYGEIKFVGKNALPLLFRAIQNEDPGIWTWFVLVCEILGEGPQIPDEDRGRLKQVRGHYVRFGQEKGYLPQSNVIINSPPLPGIPASDILIYTGDPTN